MKVKATRNLQASNKSVGLAGSPRMIAAGTEMELDKATFARLLEIYGEGSLVEAAPPPADATREAPDKPSRTKKG